MSRYLAYKYSDLEPYTPGEQPKNAQYIKLNTNESPFKPSLLAQQMTAEAAKNMQLYCDPECTELVSAMSKLYGIDKDEILFTNGSDEILNFALMAFCDDKHPAAFPDITYGFYPVFAQVNSIPYVKIPLNEDFTINVNDYLGINKTVFIANPNAPTGIALPLSDIEKIVKSNPDSIVVIDEAYVDFGAQSAVGLIKKYDNLLVTQTFSKSRSMAGARLGFGIACKELIKDLVTIKYSTNPYNVNRMTQAAGIGAISDEKYTQNNLQTIIKNREYTQNELLRLGFKLTPSSANFVFAMHPDISGEKLYLELKSRGILIRHFSNPDICDYNRITIGTLGQMQALIENIEKILNESEDGK